MENSIRTINGAVFQSAIAIGKQPTIKPNSTLNQKLNIFPEEVFNAEPLTVKEIPRIQYVVIGNKGHRITLDGDQEPDVIDQQHLARDSGLYNEIPWVLREVTDDLTPAERLKFRLRKLQTFNGKNYIAYYARVIDYTNTVPQAEHMVKINNGGDRVQFDVKPFINTSSDLNPTPPLLDNNGVIITSGDFLRATAKATISLTPSDVNEILEACKIIYGSYNKAVISEIGYCYGVDKPLQGNFNGTIMTYTDVIGCTIHTYSTYFARLRDATDGIDITVNIGCTEPLYKVNQ